MRQDLAWWWTILHDPSLNGVPLSHFGALPPPDRVVTVDASDFGLCALDPLSRRSLVHVFEEDDAKAIAEFKAGRRNHYDINFRELLSCAHAVLTWGPLWAASPSCRPAHVQFRIDNTSAVAWQSRLHSPNPRAQVLVRLLCLWEHRYNLRLSAVHLPGVSNVVADLGSRLAQRSSFEQDNSGGLRSALVHYLREHSVAPSTLSKYRRHFDQWLVFCGTVHVDPYLIGLQPDDVVGVTSAFILERSGTTVTDDSTISLARRSSTVLGILHGINHYFKSAARDFPVNHPQIRMLVKGLSYFDAPSSPKAPVSLSLLEACFRRLNFARVHDQALWGVLCVAFFFLLRRSEIVADHSTFKWFALRAHDIHPSNHEGIPTTDPAGTTQVSIELRGSKTQQHGTSIVRSLSRSGHRFICPVFGALLLKHCHASLPGDWPACTFIEAGFIMWITARDVSDAIKAAARDIGVPASQFGTHSLRIGGATQLYRAGVDTTTIQFQGRWVSDAFRRYTRLTLDVSARLAPAMISGPLGGQYA